MKGELVMSKKKKKEHIDTIDGLELLKKTRGIQRIAFRTGRHRIQKDKPRDKNWRKWNDE